MREIREEIFSGWGAEVEEVCYEEASGACFLVPAAERLADGVVVHVAGLSKTSPGRPLALTLLPDWFCLCDGQGVCCYQYLLALQQVRVVELPDYPFPRDEVGGMASTPTLALSIFYAGPFFVEELLLATGSPAEAYQWLGRILGARHALARRRARVVDKEVLS